LSVPKAIPFFTDNDVEDAVGDLLKDSGHSVTRLREVMLKDSPDPVVDANCRQYGLVLVTHNWKHFRRIARELDLGSGKVKHLSRIDMELHQSDGPRRMEEALPLIEAEWCRRGGVGLQISICKQVVRIHQ
jgi:hypothetical protein